ncbi:MAG TPA: GNAT family N-acetyltransferase [Patescibacteria group bacterium]|nr:GNAT family N-acetyltransferase [Patescibacteria group bacterium]
MVQDITVRPVQPQDTEAVQELLRQEMVHNGCNFDESSPYHPKNAAQDVIRKTMDAGNPNRGWLAFAGDKPAGIITTPMDLAGGVFVNEEFRGKGVAQALIRTREKYLKEDLGLTQIERPVRADNEASIKLHTEKLGYRFSQASLNLLKENPKPPGNTVLYLVKTL